MTCICWKLTLQIPPTSGNFQLKDLVPIPPQKKTPQLRHWNFEHLLVIQLKIKNIQILLGQKGATTWNNSGLSRWNPTQHFRNYNFVQEVAFPQWMWFRKPLFCFATVKLATCGRICDVCQTMCFLRSLILLLFWSPYPFKMGKASPRKKQNELTAIRDSPLKKCVWKTNLSFGEGWFPSELQKAPRMNSRLFPLSDRPLPCQGPRRNYMLPLTMVHHHAHVTQENCETHHLQPFLKLQPTLNCSYIVLILHPTSFSHQHLYRVKCKTFSENQIWKWAILMRLPNMN